MKLVWISALVATTLSFPLNNNNLDKLLKAVTLQGVREHQAVFQAIADAHNGNRDTGSSGFNASVDYVVAQTASYGYKVTVQSFPAQKFFEINPSVVEQVAPLPMGQIPNNVLSYSGSCNVTAAVTAPPLEDRGCSQGDFAGFPAGNIALIKRGGCYFSQKATNALNAGASGVVIYNIFDEPVLGSLEKDFAQNVCVTSVSNSVGLQLLATTGLVLRLKIDTLRTILNSRNILAESIRGDPNNVILVGAHLDSVAAGPGINDNGSGSAAILEVAKQMAKVRPRNKVRFAWWGAEELGLVGSKFYETNLSQPERDRIALYLNFDMIGSPNHVFFIFDGDDSDGVGAPAGPPGSAEIEKTFEAFFNMRGIPFKGEDFDGRSDYGQFIWDGIPAGGLFTGAEKLKTAEEAAIWGGTAGTAYDSCYHQSCDTYANNNDVALDVNSDAIAFAVLQYAMSTEDIDGVRGKGNFKPVSGGVNAEAPVPIPDGAFVE